MTNENLDNGEPAETSSKLNPTTRMSRRVALSLLGLGGLGAISSDSTTAQEDSGPPFYNWQEDVDANEHTLSELGALAMAANSSKIQDFEGENLSIEEGVLNAAAGTSLWEDTDDDELLETPDHEGVDISTIESNSANTEDLQATTAKLGDAAVGPFGLVTGNGFGRAVSDAQTPQAVYDDETNTTYITYRGPEADPYAMTYDHDTLRFSEEYQIGDNPLPLADNHGPPSVSIDNDGTLHVLYGAHNSPFQYARSTAPYDVTEWEDLGGIHEIPDGTYPSQLVLNGNIYALYRAGSGHGSSYPSHEYGTVIRSTDGGDSWQDLGPVIDLTGHPAGAIDAYIYDFSRHDGSLHISYNIAHGESHDDTRSHVFHIRYDPDSQTVYDLAGNSYGDTITWSEMENNSVVHALEEVEGVNAPNHVVRESDEVHIAVKRLNDSTGNIEWTHLHWDGTGWSQNQIRDATARSIFDGGGLREGDNGTLEAHLVTANVSDPVTSHLGERGGGYRIYERNESNGWSEGENVIGESVVTLGNLDPVGNGTDEFATLFVPEPAGTTTATGVRMYAAGAIPLQQHIGFEPEATTVEGRKARFESIPPSGGVHLLNWGSGRGADERLELRATGQGPVTYLASSDWFNALKFELIDGGKFFIDDESAFRFEGDRSSAPSPPDDGFSLYYRNDIGELRAINAEGSTSTIATFD